MKLISRFIPLLFLAPLSISAANVQYTIGDYLSFVAPDFLTNLPPDSYEQGDPTWHFTLSQVSSSVCQFQTIHPCTNISLSEVSSNSTFFDIDYYDEIDHTSYIYYNNLYLIGLGQIGAYMPGTVLSFSVQYTNLPVSYAPEPQSWMLLVAGFVFVLASQAKKLSSISLRALGSLSRR